VIIDRRRTNQRRSAPTNPPTVDELDLGPLASSERFNAMVCFIFRRQRRRAVWLLVYHLHSLPEGQSLHLYAFLEWSVKLL
jgi:hypothetical protein